MVATANEDSIREELIQRRLAGTAGGRRSRIPTADRAANLPLSFGQQQVWFLNRLEADSAEYLVPLVLQLRGRLDPAALSLAWDGVLARHEILRTRYELRDNAPVQLIDPYRWSELSIVDLTDLPVAGRRERALELVERESATGLDLEHEWPVRAALLRLAADDHILVVVFHHVACDAWSTGVFVEELGTLYAGFAAGSPAALPTLPVQYADYAAWERARLQGPLLDRHLGYWREQLAGLSPLELPTDRARPPIRDWRGAAVAFELPAPVAAGIRDLAAAEGATLFVTLLTSFLALLSRYTDSSDIPVGVVVSGRTRPELQGVIGYLIHSLVLRGRWDGDPAFTRLLSQVRSMVLDAFDHQDVPFARLVDELQPERDMSRTPLYQVAFHLHEDRSGGPGLGDVHVSPLWSPSRVSKVDLTLHIEEGAGGSLRGQLEYATALFDETTIERMVRHYLRLLGHIVAASHTRISTLAILPEAELALVTGGTATPAPVTRRVHEVFEARAAACPDAVAVVFEDTALTYAELNAQANRLAHRLRALGAGPESIVGVCLERGPDLVPTLLGVLKSGAGYLPLDPTQPADRLEFMLTDAGAAVVVTGTGQLDLLGAYAGRIVMVEELGDEPQTNLDVPGGPDNLIYVIYTSGSTGRPKGVCLTHGNVLRLLSVAERHYAFGPDDVWPLFHSYAFDVSVWELWGSLLYGGRLVVIPRAVTRSPEDFLDVLVEHRVTVLNQTPSAFRGLVMLAAAGDPRIDQLNLRAVVFAGEKLELGELLPWVARRGLDAPRLLNMYGITETTVHSTYHRVVEADLAPGARNPVGYPLDDLRIYLLDRHGRPVPVGVPGEIHVGGPGVARGYLNRPELTAQRFVPDPFGPAGGVLYRSGDLAARHPDGSLDFRGRIDDQIKMHGYRIELGEIEAAMAAIPGLRDVVVILREDIPGDRRLVGYGVPADGHRLASSDIRAQLARSLPEYMIPSAFVPLGKLPLTANGKLDRRALPPPDRSSVASQQEYAPPRTSTEERIAGIWRDVLGVGRIGIDDSFFDVGGDSILAVALVGALRTARFDLAVRDIFEYRTVAALAEFLNGRAAPAAPEPAVVPFALISAEDRAGLTGDVVDAYPCSQVQLGMLVEMLTDDGRNHYHNVTSFRLLDGKPFDLAALRAAGRLVVRRHEILRTSFELTGYSVPMQLVHGAAELSVDARDLSGLTGEEVKESLRAFMAAERLQLFDLGRAPLVRFHAHVTDDQTWWITITECHAVLEGWSHHSLIMELVNAYHRIREGLEPAPFDPLPVRYADFIAAELQVLESDVDISYWRDIVTRYPKFTLPGAWADPLAPAGEPYEAWITIRDLEPQLRALASKARVPFKAVLHAAYLKVMSQLTDEETFFSGLVCNGRPEAVGADRVYGLHLNPLPFAHDRTARTWRELVQQVFAREIELWPHRRYPLPTIQREIGGGQRLLDARFSYHDFHQIDTALVDYEATIDDSPNEFPLGVESRAGFMIITANPRLVGRSHVDRMGAMFRAVMEAMAADIDGDAQETYLGDAERGLLLDRWPGQVRPAGPDTVLSRFEVQVATTPYAVAVTAAGTDVTYGQLDARANQVARHLGTRGVAAGSVVAVLLDRGVDLLATLLGVWKAGAAYMPIDPTYPADRIATMLADAAARLAVTSAEYADRFTVDVLPIGAVDGPATGVAHHTDPDELAYVIFTSGSTGRPKGVQITHRGLVNHVGWAADELASKGTGGAPLFSSVAFDLVVPNLWAPLVSGQRVFLADHDLDLADLGTVLRGAAPFSFIKLTPGHLEILGQQLDAAAAAALAPVIVVAGEALSGSLANRWRELLPAGGLINEYGPTEASVGTCIFPVRDEQRVEVVPIGRPLPNQTMYVLDARMRPCPVGVVGELYVGGTGVARGYANRPDLTAEKFVPHPFGLSGARLYRTGDRVRWLPEGSVDFLGRIDDQVKIRGYRIEPGEIRAVLAEHPAVRDVAVVARSTAATELQIVAYYVPAGPVAAADLAAHCAERLPDYMMPTAFVMLDAIPLNANGKVDRTALPDPNLVEAAERALVAPRTALEEEIAAVWLTVLALPQVSVEDSFFDVGGHSIRAIALVGALRAAGHQVAVRDVFAHRTVAALAALLAGRNEPVAPAASTVVPFALISAADRAVLPAGVVDAYPISQVQLGMLVLTLTDDESVFYHNFSAFRIRDDQPFSIAALQAAMTTVVGRHETLRTSFQLSGYSMPLQFVHEQAAVGVRRVDLRDGDPEVALRAFAAAERVNRFDLAAAPQLRAAGLVESGRSWWLALTMSHAIIEGWSHQALLMEILDTYRQIRDGLAPAEYHAPAVRYADFIAGELESLESTEDRAYWQGIVDGHARFALPAGWGEDPSAPNEVRGTTVPLRGLLDDLRALATRAEVSLKSVLFAAHLKVLSQLTDADRFYSGLVCHGRPEMDGADRVYGMHLNTLPFGYDRTAGTWRDLVRQVFDGEIGMWPHRRYPLPSVQRLAGGGRLLDVLFTYLEFDGTDRDRVDVDAAIEEAPNEFSLNVNFLDGNLSITTSSHALSQDNVLRIAEMHRLVLAAMVEDLDGDARATYLPAAELRRLTGRNAATPGVTRCLHELFEEQAARTPDAPAVTADGRTLSYAELNARANRLAHRLAGFGVGPDLLVGICLDRGLDLVVALIAVLKAGAGYLPLDPTYPAERREFMLADAGALCLISSTERIGALPGGTGYGVVLMDRESFADQPDTNPVPVAGPDNLIYVIYTSGSTGRPKGVALSHASVHRLFTATDAQFRFAATDVWALFHSYAFDFSVWEFWGPLLYGGRLVVVPADVARSPEDLLDLLVEQRVTILNQTPSAFRALVTAAAEGAPQLARLHLRAIVFGGEKLELAEIAPWVSRLGLDSPVLINMYGITETTVHTTYHRVTPADLRTPTISPAGEAISDLRVHLLDKHAALVPLGVPGEIYVGGPGLARCYLNRPILTAERFVPDPFGAPGQRLYRSGDLARRGFDGGLEMIGRIDDQVKIRGYRIELGEIAAALAAQSGIRDAVVVVHDGGLVGYLVPAGAAVPSPAQLRASLAERLPDYMVPAAFVTLARIPLTTTGKLDRGALPVPDASARVNAREYLPPQTPTQERIAAVWLDVLGLDRIGINDSFFDVGGDSLRAVGVVGALRAAGLDVGVRDVFVHQTVARLAGLVDAADAPSGPLFQPVASFAQISAADRGRLPVGVVDAYPATQAQLGMAVEMQNDTTRVMYHIVASFRVVDDRPLDAAVLKAAVAAVVHRHETLRTSFHLVGYSVPLQLVHAAADVPVEVYATAAGRPAFLDAQRATPFDLDRPGLLRVAAHLDTGAWWLTLTVSHLVTGGWDFQTLLAEVLDTYRQHSDPSPPGAAVRAEPTDVVRAEPSGVRYADFVAAELASLESTEDRAYWRGVVDQYARFALPLGWGEPADRPREGYEIRVPYRDLAPALRALAAAASASIKAVLHAAHLKVISQLTEEERFFTGLVCDARPEVAGADGVHGMYVNTLPFAFARGPQTWRALVRDVFDREVELWPHRRFPLPAIQREAGTGRHPIEVIFDFMDYRQAEGTTADIDVDGEDGEGTTEFGLMVATIAGSMCLTTNTHVLSRANARRLAAMYRAVLESMAAGPDGDARATYLPHGEREDLLAAVPAPTGPTSDAVEMFEGVVRERADAAAVVFDGVVSSYREVNVRANRLGWLLRSVGAGPEVVVGVCLPRGEWLVPALLGVWKSGAGYLPLEPGLPDERLGFMVGDAGVRVVVTDAAGAARLAGVFAGQLVVLDEVDWPGWPSRNPPPATGPDHVAYVMFTSGSTGRPKGVMATHANVSSFMAAAGGRFGFGPDDVLALFHSFAFDVSVWEIWGALLFGGSVVVLAGAATLSPDELLDVLVREKVTVLHQTPSAFRGLVGLAAAGDGRVDGLALRAVILAGEAPRAAELVPWVTRRGLGSTAVHNMYGITETTVESMSHRFAVDDLFPGSNPIGTPMAGVGVRLLDTYGRLVPVGVPGEVYVSGPGVARGYLGRGDLTAQRFLPDPYGAPGSRHYRSGDLARRRADGTLELLGRIDDQVKVRGFRVELGEISAVLTAHPQLHDAAVIVREDSAGDRRLVAYVITGPGPAPTPAQLAAWCAERLPGYMMPTAYQTIDTLPLTSTGKLDKLRLPAPDRAAMTTSAYQPPTTPAEQRIVQVWQSVLGVDRVGVNDNFFDLGGDSIRAVSLVGALRAAGYATSVRDVFALRTVARLAGSATESPVSDEVVVAPFAMLAAPDRAALPEGLTDAYPVSQIQLGMLLELLAGDAPGAYHSVETHQVHDEKPFSAPAMVAALPRVLARHEVLRTSFALTGYTVPLQLVHAEVESTVAVHDYRGELAAEQVSALESFVATERGTPFALDAAPLIRVHVHLESDQTWWLTLTFCHAITEGWSINLLRQELLDAYCDLRDGRETAAVEPPRVRYADFIAAELASLGSTEDSGYWQGIVAEHAPFTVPAGWSDGLDRPRTAHRASVSFRDLAEGLRALATAEQVSLKAVLHAVHLKVMSQLTGEERFFTGLVCDARPEALGADRVHGMFLNTLPFAHDRAAGSWRELVRQVFDREVELWPHRRYPLPAIQRTAGRRMIEVFFNYQDFTGQAVEAEEGLAFDASFGEGATEFALAVITIDGQFELSTNSHVLSRASLDRVAAMYRAALEAMTADPDGDARAVCLPPGERDRLIGGRDTAGGEPVTRLVHEVFQERAAQAPDAVAVVFDTESLTYGQLNARANRLAHHLRSLGANPEKIVAVCLERGPDLVPALLGVLKSGAAYLPLDLAQPADRLAFMLADAGAELVVTRAVHRHLFDQHPGRLVLLDDPAVDVGPDTDPPVLGHPNNLIYVIYTSGSTGRPKGVCLTHANVLRLLTSGAEHYAFDKTDVWPLFHSYAFDVSVWELWGSLLYGGRLVVVPHEVTRSPEEFLDLLVEHRVTMLNQTPSAFRGLVALAAAGDPRIERLALRAVVFAGEKLEMPDLRPWVDRLGLARIALLNMYGITETTVHSTYHRVTQRDLEPAAGNRIGRPLSDLRIYLLDRHGDLVPVGVPGEIYVGGPGVARGYFNRPELTAQRFVPDPFGPPASRLYRSGDLARRLPDGSLEFTGRIDDQVKIRGYRIELGEIEAVLGRIDGIRDTVVTVREDMPGDKRLVAYVVRDGNSAPGPADLRSLLARGLPEYMVPTAFVALDRLPLTPNGKLDRRALPRPDQDAMPTRREYAPPRTAVERRLATIWQEVLGVARVGLHDRFFELGGHSVLIVQVITAAQQAGLELALRSLYQDPTLAELAAALDPAAATPLPAALDPAAATPLPSVPLRSAPASPVPARPVLNGRPGGPIRFVGPAAFESSSRPDRAVDEPIPSPVALMTTHRVPGATVALYRNHELVAVRGYGTLTPGGAAVTPETLFQVGSISKQVSTLGALRLVRDGLLVLDADVNEYLSSWRVPGRGVTMRHLLGHLSGLTAFSNAEFAVAGPAPTLLDLLAGRPPATNPPVALERVPGDAFQLANIGFWVLQQLLEDVTGTPFAVLMNDLVLAPLEMTGSSFHPSFPQTAGRPVALGHDASGVAVPGGWRIRPDTAAAGMWSTAPDLGRVSAEIRSAYLGGPSRLLTRDLARELLAVVSASTLYGLGTVVDGTGPDVEFGHAGERPGYQAIAFSRLRAGDGIVVLTNGDAGKTVAQFMVSALGGTEQIDPRP